jgi:hypothetical protein
LQYLTSPEHVTDASIEAEYLAAAERAAARFKETI